MTHKIKNTLVIVESPAKAKTIKKYLGSGYTVTSSVGHVRDIPKSNKDAVDIKGGFIPKYINSPGKEKVIKELKILAKKSDVVLLASDPDREGEAIAWHVSELIKKEVKEIKRIVFNEITKDAVQEALKHPRKIDLDLKEAQEARRILDRLVGYDLSGLIWKKVRYGLSAGRVQSPALRIVMEKERKIRLFVPEDFFVLTAHTKKDATEIPFICTEEPSTEVEASRIKKVGEENPWEVTGIKETQVNRSPKAPFTTSTLQQVASTRLGFSPSRTMTAAQKLYEAGHITYMRTDSTTMSEVAMKQILGLIKTEYGPQYVEKRTYKTKNKSAQEAHEAVRPTNFSKLSVGNTVDQKNLYELIYARTVSSQMSDAKTLRTKIIANIQASINVIPDFSVKGSRVVFDGWLKADPRARGEDVQVPKIEKGDKLNLQNIEIEAKQTTPPSRYSEAGLIKELEKRGIGRPSTYASIMRTIIDRGYVIKEGRTLIPTDTGDVVSSFLEEHFASYIGDDFTSDMENQLDDIANGTRKYKNVLTDFYTPFSKAVSSKADIPKLTNQGKGPEEFKCPKCNKDMVIKLGRAGKFLSCETFPECDGARMIDGSEAKDSEPIGKHAETGEDIFILTGRFGPYIQLGVMPATKDPDTGKTIPVKKRGPKPRRSSIPDGVNPEDITVEEATRFLLLPRELGTHPATSEPVIAGAGQFGPYIVHAGDYRSLKGEDNPYDITHQRALQILSEPKQGRKGETLIKELGLNPKTKKLVNVYKSKSGRYLRKGFNRVMLPENTNLETFTVEDAIELLKPR